MVWSTLEADPRVKDVSEVAYSGDGVRRPHVAEWGRETAKRRGPTKNGLMSRLPL